MEAEIVEPQPDVQDAPEAVAISLPEHQPGGETIEPKPAKMDRLERLKLLTQKNPWSVESWSNYLSEATQKSDPAIGRDAFEAFLKQFPTSYRHWIQYIEFEQRHRAFENVEALFRKCLPMVVSVELWRFYLNYIKRTHATGPSSTAEEKTESRRVISEAYEFVLTNVGQDKDAGALWLEYIQFIKSGEAANTYEEQQRMDQLRKIFHKALSIPLSNVEVIWKDYDAFENGLNKITAKKLLSEKSAIYMTARTAYRELKNRMSLIDAAQKTWSATSPLWTQKEFDLLEAWKDCLSWERSNPLHIEDNSSLISRVMYTFKSALLMMRYFPEIWYSAAEYLKSIGKQEDAILLLKQAVDIMPRSVLLTFALCETEEILKKDSGAISDSYEKLIKTLEEEVNATNLRYDQERKDFLDSLSVIDPDDLEADWDGERREREREKQRENEKEVEIRVEARRKEDIEKLKSAVTVSWIVYMRFSRRSQNIRAAREVFKKARKSPLCKYQLYVASGLMEYYCSKDANVATKVFEAGLKAFTDEESLSCLFSKYFEFLLSIDDQNNARALFERALSSLKPENCRQIWSKFLNHEIQFGDISIVVKSEKRFTEFYSEEERAEHRLERLAERWSFLDLSYVGDCELGLSALSVATRQKSPKRQKGMTKDKSLPSDSLKVDRYPRPDFSKWNVYKPEIPPPGSIRPTLSTQDQGPSPSITPTGPSSQPTTMIPEAIVRFLDLLPAAAIYNGPIIPVNDVLELLRHIPVPLPTSQPNLAPIALPKVSSSLSSSEPPSRLYDNPPSDRSSRYPSSKGRDGRDGRDDRGMDRGFKRKGGYGSDEGGGHRRYPDQYGSRHKRGRDRD
ncbi:mRNA 3'-end-processing protein rna14 [Dinochytrium kinnereticum]|nr:mRNA 3'-end-processing protein rna14 [Dinochytrium kinnereticum]